ncbi:DoxX family protein [Niabella sp. CC-SYL272]|uniref:BT_3928 family protein n=1 Tax=Niabella agricola TaxID=2891571 RepID=UPI001F3F00D1|nr:BT_3928 family protein [Niabella agricola]MCF3108386.1 DoxX family protein [Niabella agricola]
MKILVAIVRVIVGVLFIFSGLIKANDPIGLSYKMQEFFELWRMSALNGITLTLSVLMIAFEIIAGAALLLGWKKKPVAWLLLLLIVFFTFLTGYAHFSGKFTNCGCFGDCIPITSKTSFIKDLVLLVLILFLFINLRYVQPVFSARTTAVLMVMITGFSFAGQWYTLKYLPVLDCLPFKKGSFIPDKLKIPANAIPDSTEIVFVYEKDGKKVEFNAEQFPADFNDSTYKFINRYDKLIKAGSNNIPEIRGFDFADATGNNVTQQLLGAEYVLLLFHEDMSHPVNDWKRGFEPIYQKARAQGIPMYIISSTAIPVKQSIAGASFKDLEVLAGDRVMIRMAARTNPTIYLLKKGTVAGKWSYKNFNDALQELERIATVH